MPRPARLLLALALVALSSTARADETRHAKKHHHHRRAKLEENAGRAPRDGSTGAQELTTTSGSKAPKHPPATIPESVGSPNDGHLKGGAHLDLKKPYFRVVPAYESGDVRWGLPVMINMIDRAARTVNKRFPGSVLDVGDISQKGGGDILRHHSHESGRDADLGFYAVDAKGRQIHARTLIKFDSNMQSPTVPGARYDMARNWAFIEQLLTDPAARVSHIFIAEWIRHEVLAYARPRVSHALYERAALVMMQPHNSLPHDDHIHVRISCPRDEHGVCIELASNMPHGKPLRVAHKSHPGTGRVLRTPVTHPHPHHAPPSSAAAPQDPALDLDVDDDVDSHDDVDESGAARITD